MPVTKKKGAIFAIYADSPTTGETSAAQKAPIHPPSPTKSKGEASRAPRKALAPLQQGKTNPPTSHDDSHSIKGKPAPKSNTTLRPTHARTGSVKRPFDVRSPSPTKESAGSSSAKHASSSSRVRFEGGSKTSRQIRESPAKKTRPSVSTPRSSRRYDTKNKENLPPTNDSPASRTRSKTRAVHGTRGSISSLSAIAITSPLQPIRFGHTIGGETGDKDAVEGVASLVGNGRGALSLKKGRELASILGSSLEVGEEASETLFKAEGSSKNAKGTPKGKGLAVKADGPLADVSEAYGASGEEPEGFRTAGRT